MTVGLIGSIWHWLVEHLVEHWLFHLVKNFLMGIDFQIWVWPALALAAAVVLIRWLVDTWPR